MAALQLTAAQLWVAVGLCLLCSSAFAVPGDVIASSNFRTENWQIYAPKGTQSTKGLELDFAQNVIKLKDGGNYEWWFESPSDWFMGDQALAYNGTIQIHLQHLEWEQGFKDGYDIVLVCSKKKHSLGLKGMKKDGEASKVYSVLLHEDAGWEYSDPAPLRKAGGMLRTKASKEQLIYALNNMVSIRIRGGYYMGVEKTQLSLSSKPLPCHSFGAPGSSLSAGAEHWYHKRRISLDSRAQQSQQLVDFVLFAESIKIIQGVMGGDEMMEGSEGCCGGKQKSCMSKERYELVFNNPGMDCTKMNPLAYGTLAMGDMSTDTTKLVRLQPDASSPDYDFYINKRLDITGGFGAGSTGFITDYLGKLEFESGSGITQVNILDPGSGCQGDGQIVAEAPSGSGFLAAFSVQYSIPTVTINAGGVGCSGGAVEDFSVSSVDSTTGAVLELTPGPATRTGAGYISGSAIIHCEPDCTGSGLAVTCTANSAGDVLFTNITNAGTGYSTTNPPTIKCPEGTLTLVDANNQGSGFAAVVSTNGNGAIDGVLVTNPGSGYSSALSLTHTVKDTCIEVSLTPDRSGYFTNIMILNNGNGYSGIPGFNIYTGGSGCKGFSLQGRVQAATPDVLVDAPTSLNVVSLGVSASQIDSFYNGQTLIMTSGAAKGDAITISSYSVAGRIATLASNLSSLPAVGDAYAITPTIPRVLNDTARGVNFLEKVIGATAGALSCSCAGVSYTTPFMCTNSSDTCGNGGCTCTIQLASTAPTTDGFFEGETIYFNSGESNGQRAHVLTYDGQTQTVTIAAAGTAWSGYINEIAANKSVSTGSSYAISASYMARVPLTLNGDSALAKTSSNSTYTISYEDFSGAVQAHMAGRPFFCEQAVGMPNSDWITMPFKKTFAFRSVPLICSVGTLTIAVETRLLDDLLWQDHNLTVYGEHGEFLGSLFTDPSYFQAYQEGGPIYDSFTLSQEKMLEMSSDRDFVIRVESHNDAAGGIRFKYMKLAFTPTACFETRVATDVFEEKDTSDHRVQELTYNLNFYLPPAATGVPSSDGVLTVTADADLSEGYVELRYGGELQEKMYNDWVWGEHHSVYVLSEPADVSEQCSGIGVYPSYSCTRATSIKLNNTRTGRHTAHHRIPREELAKFASSGVMPVTFVVKNSKSAAVKFSPVRLTYSLMACKLMTLTAEDNQIFGQPIYRPSFARFEFPGDAPPAAGPATLWIKAYIQSHSLHVADSIGLPNGRPRIFRMDKGEPYQFELDTARDPEAAQKIQQKRWPHLGAMRVMAGDRGEFIDFMFHDDYAQYDQTDGFVDSVNIPLGTMVGSFSRLRKISFTLEVPPGDSTIKIISAVIAYPTTEA